MANWQVQTAKAKLSELLDAANKIGPQTITKHGKAAAIILSPQDFEDLRANNENSDFLNFLMAFPSDLDFQIDRKNTNHRNTEF